MQDITLENFETELIHASQQQPVLLDIWAPWCGPCKALGPVLEKLETAYDGRFRLAKLNSDEQPEIAGQLSQAFGVRSIPFCVLFKDGQPVDGFVGALPEREVRKFLDKHVPSAEDVEAGEHLEEAQTLAAGGDASSAIAKLRDAVDANPANDAVRYDYLRALVQAGDVAEAKAAYEPVAGQTVADVRFAAVAAWIAAREAARTARPVDSLEAVIAANKRDFDARFELAQTHFAAGRRTDAMDALLEIVMRDKNWRDGLARKTYVAILELMTKPAPKPEAAAPKGTLEVAAKAQPAPGDPVVDSYRRKLSMAVF